MFYVYSVSGFALFVAGLILIPGLWKLAWVAAWLLLLTVLPSLLARILDPLNARRIRTYCAEAGVTDVEVQPFPNHYGVHFRKNDRKHYVRCTVVRGRIRWQGPSPSDVQ